MKATIIILMSLLCLQVSAQQHRKTTTKRQTSTMVKRNAPQTVIKTREKGEDGFIWYKLKKGKLFGAADIDGNTIIPIKYDFIEYNSSAYGGTHYFSVKNRDYMGAYTRRGRCIISPDKHFTIVFIKSHIKKNVDKVLLYVKCENNMNECAIYDIKGNEVIAPGFYDNLYMTNDLDNPVYICWAENDRYGAFDLNGNLLTKPVADAYIWIYKDKIEIVNQKGKDDYEYDYIYGSYSDDTRFDFGNYDGLYSPFKSYKLSSSSSTSSSSKSSSSSSSTSSSSSSTSSTVSTPTRQLQPVQEWNPCLGCGGTGLCTYCQGKGQRWYGNSYENCVICHGSMYCTQCFGKKGYYTTVYR